MHHIFFALTLLLCISSQCLGAGKASLYLSLPLHIRSNLLNQKVANLCPGIEISIFGRPKDFNSLMMRSKPSAILTLPLASKIYSEYSPVLQGIKSGSPYEQYFFATTHDDFKFSELSSLKIGVVDLFGRKKMVDFMQSLFNTKLSLKRVIRSSDLLPLLRFELVDAIFISEGDLQMLKGTTRLKLNAWNSKRRLKRPQLAVLDLEQRDYFVDCILSFDPPINHFFNIESWSSL